MRLLLSPSPRRLILATESFVLVFSPPPPAESHSPDVVVEFLPAQEFDFDGTVALHSRVAGCLGVLRLGDGKLLARSELWRAGETVFGAGPEGGGGLGEHWNRDMALGS